MFRRIYFLAFVPMILWGSAYPCSLIEDVSSTKMVKEADAIVRAEAAEYIKAPRNFPKESTTGEPNSTIRFKVLEVIRGSLPSNLILPGYLVENDDFNDHGPPYNFVRPNGRRGSCFANSYRLGGQFLLLLKKRSGEYTVNWYALGPVNEQLHSANDAWLLWVREEAKKQSVPHTK